MTDDALKAPRTLEEEEEEVQTLAAFLSDGETLSILTVKTHEWGISGHYLQISQLSLRGDQFKSRT